MPETGNPRVAPWEIPELDFYTSVPLEERLKFLLRYAVLAPSSHNAQPWKFEVRKGEIWIYGDPGRRLPAADPDDREMILGIGAAILNLRVAAAHFGAACEVRYRPDPGRRDLLACARLWETSEPDRELADLFPAIPLRRTHRGPYLARPLAEADLRRLRGLPEGREAGVRIFIDRAIQARVAELVRQGDRILFSRPAFRRELGDWVRPARTLRGDGIAGDGLGIPGILSPFGPWFLRTFNTGRIGAGVDARRARDASALAVVTSRDLPESLLEAGEIMERFLLTLTRTGLQYAYLNQPVEVPELREALRSHLGLADGWPQVLLRIGYAAPRKSAMPRRPLDDSLIEEEPA